jgi:hypothetical protein
MSYKDREKKREQQRDLDPVDDLPRHPPASAMAVGLASCTSMSRMVSSWLRPKLGFLPR